MVQNANIDQLVSFGKDNVEALVKSSSLAVKGLEELSKVYAALANQSVEQTSAAVKALSSAKSPTEFQSIYNDLAKNNFEQFIAESRKIQELTNSLVTSSVAPLSARVQALQSMYKVA
ncbi:phasin protein [mine drainage metagenome]|uniref:Phasin protein n=1 Tax=mine drainage metagenome TaxID=410659 RepID=A0A1J5S035_9ZZZZ